VAGIFTELSPEKPECFQERRFLAKLLSNNPLSTKYFITLCLNTSVSFDVSFKEKNGKTSVFFHFWVGAKKKGEITFHGGLR
jgi:hypothetical protein